MGAFATNADLLLASGRDAMSNLYDIYIIPPHGLGIESALSTTAAMVIRSQDFQPPVLEGEVYKNHYKMDHIDVPSPKIIGEKTFDVEYRLDAAYGIHNALRKWKYRSTLNPTMTDIDGDVGGYTYNGIWGYKQGEKVFGRVAVVAHKFADIFDEGINNVMDSQGYGIAAGLISALGEAGTNYVGWVFDNCWVEKTTEPSYTRESATPLKATATFRFTSMSLIGADTSSISTLVDALGGNLPGSGL